MLFGKHLDEDDEDDEDDELKKRTKYHVIKKIS